MAFVYHVWLLVIFISIETDCFNGAMGNALVSSGWCSIVKHNMLNRGSKFSCRKQRPRAVLLVRCSSILLLWAFYKDSAKVCSSSLIRTFLGDCLYQTLLKYSYDPLFSSYCFTGFLKLLTPNDENKVCLDHTLLSKTHSSKLWTQLTQM